MEFRLSCINPSSSLHWDATDSSYTIIVDDKELLTLKSHYYGCWFRGGTRSQSTSSSVIDLVILEYSGFTNEPTLSIYMYQPFLMGKHIFVNYCWTKWEYGYISSLPFSGWFWSSDLVLVLLTFDKKAFPKGKTNVQGFRKLCLRNYTGVLLGKVLMYIARLSESTYPCSLEL